MLVFDKAELAYLAVPKTGSTAVEAALRPHASLCFGKPFKHITAQRFKNRVAPFLRDSLELKVETCAVIRDPLDHIRSWYRYRSRPTLDHEQNSTQGMDFDDFVRACLDDKPPPCAAIGSQFRFLSNARGKVIVDHLFAYEAMDQFQDFLTDRLGVEFDLALMNVSPHVETALSPCIEAQLRKTRRADFALHQELRRAGGYMRAPSTTAAACRPSAGTKTRDTHIKAMATTANDTRSPNS